MVARSKPTTRSAAEAAAAAAKIMPPHHITTTTSSSSSRNKGKSKALTEANDASGDIASNNTPLYILKLAPIVDWCCFLSSTFFGHIFGYFVFAYQMYYGYYFSWKRIVFMVLLGYFKLVLTFGIYHRFFAHKSYSCPRPVAFILGILASTGAQRGPLWWGSKHVRHHKFCENEGDPHSVLRTGSFLYCFVGWSVMTPEMKVDWEYVHAEFKQPEMLLCEFISTFIPATEMYLWYYFGGIENAIMEYYATVIAVYITLSFNVGLHHDNLPEEAPVNGRYKCKAHDACPWYLKYTLDLIGELNHYDHHRYPRRALHPSHSGIDLTYWALIWPFEKMGIFYNVNHDGRGRSKGGRS